MNNGFKGDGQTKRRETPPTWKEPDDPNKSGFEYPNYTIWHTRDGAPVLRVDSTKGSESVSIEGRGGTGIHFLTNNGMKLVANYGRTDITYGQHRSVVTGAHDATYKGDSSTKTVGIRRINNQKDVEESTGGKFVSTAKSYNMSAGEHFDIAAQSAALKTKNGITIESGDGPISMTGKGSATLQSKGGGSVGMDAVSGSAVIQAAFDVAVKGQEVHIKGGGAEVVLKNGKVYINSGESKEPSAAWKGIASSSDTSGTEGYSSSQIPKIG